MTVLVVALVGLLSLGQVACTTTVAPLDPRALREPVSVFLVDYHRHSSLMLPRNEEGGGLREYAYGEWAWFAENRTGGKHAVDVMLLPSQGALGRADHPMLTSAAELRHRRGFEAVHEIRVERALALSLLEHLDERFESRRDTMIANPTVGLVLVKDDERDSLANHCNHATVRWLRELGVRAGPATAVARFHVLAPDTTSRERQPAAAPSPAQ